MKFLSHKRNRPNVPIVPLIDILTILLIFFIVTATFKKKDEDEKQKEGSAQKNEALLNITLPNASNLEVKLNPGERLTLGLTPEGDIYLEDALVKLEELVPILQGLKLEKPDIKLELRTDTSVPFGQVIKLWNTLGKAGIKLSDVPARVLVGAEDEEQDAATGTGAAE